MKRKNYTVHVWPLTGKDNLGKRKWKSVLEVYSEAVEDWLFIDVDINFGKPKDYKSIAGRVQEIVGDSPPDLTTPEIIEGPDLVDPWPLLPERTEEQRRKDGIEVNGVLYDMNKDNAIDAATGKDTLKQFSYHEIEPIRKINRKK